MSFQVTDVQKALKGANYPATSDELAELAGSNGADDGLVEALRGAGGRFEAPTEVMERLKGGLGG